MTLTRPPHATKQSHRLDFRLASGLTNLAKSPETLLVALIAAVVLTVCLRVPSFFGFETLFNILTASMVSVIFAVGVLLVLLSGGIDVSFLSFGIFAAYAACKIGPQTGGGARTFVPFLVAIAIGALLGLLNAFIVVAARVSVLIATLATGSIATGVLFAFVGGAVISTLPQSLEELGHKRLISVPAAVRGTTSLSVLVLVAVAVCLLVWLFLSYTIRGRTVYALGGSPEAAARAGISVAGTRVVVFCTAGGLAGLAGMVSVTLSGRADPTVFSGGELDVLAAVVLGGALVTGGKGTIRGVVLGVLLIAVIDASLVPLGIPSLWQKTAVGSLLLIGVTLQSVTTRRRSVRPILEQSSHVTD